MLLADFYSSFYPLNTFSFFFSCYGDHRDLHSFPTRRSSDLPVQPNRHDPADRPRDQELDPPRRVHQPAPRPRRGGARRGHRGRADPAAPHPHDFGRDGGRCAAHHARPRRRRAEPPAARLRDRRRGALLDHPDALSHTGGLRDDGRPDPADPRPPRGPRPRADAPRRGDGMTARPFLVLALAAAGTLGATPAAAQGDTLPVVTLADAISRASRFDPDY